MDQNSPDIKTVQKNIEKAYKQVGTYILKSSNKKLKEFWTDWLDEFKKLNWEAVKNPEVAISLVGGTGAGKSSLINAIVGARLLPVSNNRACTSAVTQIGYSPGAFQAQVEFLSREEWSAEVEQIQADLRDALGDDRSAETTEYRLQTDSIIRDKLWPLYRSSPDEDISRFDPFKLVEHPDVTRYLNEGKTEFRSAEIKDFRNLIGQFLESKQRFWPIVKGVSISGPFDALSDGVKLIDLPGVNDPNEAREEVTRQHLKTCRYVWIVFNIKRALTKDTLSLMQSEDFLRQIVMDGRTNALTFVGTAADDIDSQAAIDEFEMDEDASDAEIISARNNAVCDVVRDQLDQLARKMAAMAQEERAQAEKLSLQMKGSQIFTVSSRDFLILSGLGRREPTRITHPIDTQIPALREHLKAISADFGIRAHARMVDRQLRTFIDRIKREVDTQRSALKNQRDLSERQREELGAAVNAARTFLDRELDDTQQRFSQALESSQEVLVERVSRAVDRAKHQLKQTYERWRQLHHSTLKAVCRRGGIHQGKLGRSDFASDLAEPILNTIAFAWSDFFGERLRTVLQRWTDRLYQSVAVYRQNLSSTLRDVPHLPEGVIPSLERNFDTTERILKEMLAQSLITVETRIQEVQRSLYEEVPQQIRSNMSPAFEDAAKEKGSGMKERINFILSQHANSISDVMFNDARDAILGGVRGLNDTLQRDYVSMVEAVTRAANVTNENLAVGQTTPDVIDLNQQIVEFDGCQNIVDEF